MKAKELYELIVTTPIKQLSAEKLAKTWLAQQESTLPPRLPSMLVRAYCESSPFCRLTFWVEFGDLGG
jgi:hypothetical protein